MPPPAPEPTAEELASQRTTTVAGLLSAASTLNELSGQYGLMSGAHLSMLMAVMGADEMVAGELMVAQSVAAAFAEFIAMPIAGQLSDSCGRRPVLVAAAWGGVALRLLVVAKPTLATVWAAKLGDALVRSFDGTVASALADLTGSDDMALAKFRGLIWATQGLAATGGPLVGSLLAVINPRLVYLAAAIVSAAMAAVATATPETLPPSERQPFRGSMCNPFSFLQLLLATGPYAAASTRVRRKIQALGLSNGLMMLPIFGVYDAEELFFRGDLGMDAAAVGWFRSMDGFAEVSQGLLLGTSLRVLGRARHTLAVRFQSKNPDFLIRNPDLLIWNLDFLLKNVDFIIKQGNALFSVGYALLAAARKPWQVMASLLVSKNEELCIQNEEFCIKNEEFCSCSCRASLTPPWRPPASVTP